MSAEITMSKKRTSVERNNQSAIEKNEKKAFQNYFISLIYVGQGYTVVYQRAKCQTKSIPYFKVIKIFKGEEILFENTTSYTESCTDYRGLKSKDIYNTRVMKFMLDHLPTECSYVEKLAKDVSENSRRPGFKNEKY